MSSGGHERSGGFPNDPGTGASIARIDVGVGGLPLPVTGVPAGQASPTGATTPQATPAQPTATTALPLPTATTASVLPPPPPDPVQPEPTVTTIEAPVMPRTGAEQWPLLAALLLGSMALLIGAVIRRRSSVDS